MQLGRAHIIRDSTLRELEGRIAELMLERQHWTARTLHVIDTEGERSPVVRDTTWVDTTRDNLQALRSEHESELARIDRRHRVRLAHAVAELEAAVQRTMPRPALRLVAPPPRLTDASLVPRATPPKNPIILPESALAHQLLDGLEGLEIGPGAHSPFGLNTRSVGLTQEMDPVDFEFCRQYQIGFCGNWARIDIAGDAENIPVPDSSTDFVIHAHVWEHLSNPLRGLDEWVRVVRSNGIVFAIVPKRDTVPADVVLPVTPLSEHILHYLLRTTYDERVDPQCRGREHHVSRFTLESLREIGDWFNWYHQGPSLSELAALETDDKAGNGHLIAWRVHKPA